MERQGYTEKDWKLFRSRIAGWQEAYMDRLNKEYIELLRSDEKASEKFWELDKRIREDQKKVGVIADMRRSRLIANIISLLYEGAICYDDLEGFSEELRETVCAYTDRNFLREDIG